MTTDIKPDTSLYPNDLPSRFRALALIAEGIAQGKELHAQLPYDPVWRITENPTWSKEVEYRLKPEPRVVWVNFYRDGRNSHYSSAEAAKRAAGSGEYAPMSTAVRVELPE